MASKSNVPNIGNRVLVNCKDRDAKSCSEIQLRLYVHPLVSTVTNIRSLNREVFTNRVDHTFIFNTFGSFLCLLHRRRFAFEIKMVPFGTLGVCIVSYRICSLLRYFNGLFVADISLLLIAPLFWSLLSVKIMYFVGELTYRYFW